nr:PREDICTED: proteasome assembly chaperone 3 [Apteryx mantelli mantelli]
MAASPVVTSRQRAAVVRGVPTEVVCTAFSNAVLVVATQMWEGPPKCNGVYLYTLAFQPLVHVCAKNLVAFVSQEAGNKPVLLAMALKDKTVEGIQALREVIRSCQVW